LQGLELRGLRERLQHERVAYAGDGANDLCPALSLGPDDVVFARKGHSLERLLAERGAFDDSTAHRTVAAKVQVWETHEELLRMVQAEFG
jgi:2-hydroxy-3-keto-5-methylthiopentenyl-1-phosphate phosphatase